MPGRSVYAVLTFMAAVELISMMTVCCWWIVVTNACEQASCSHLCLPTLHYPGFTCACPSNNRDITYSLSSDRQTCLSSHGQCTDEFIH